MLDQQQYFNWWYFNVEPMLNQCQHANNDVLPTTPTITQLITIWDSNTESISIIYS